jgi:riboflavin synthase
MFNGIIESIGRIVQIKNEHGCKHFSIQPVNTFADLTVGESIAMNGVCLTITDFTEQMFNVTAVPETLRLTNLDQLTFSQFVNLERAMPFNGRFSGHYVQGHVDAVAEILALKNEGEALLVTMSIPPHLTKYVVKKGYITLDGMSITVVDISENYFTVTFIPHTQEITIIKPQYQIGIRVNIEVDVIGKHIEKLLEVHYAR